MRHDVSHFLHIDDVHVSNFVDLDFKAGRRIVCSGVRASKKFKRLAHKRHRMATRASVAGRRFRFKPVTGWDIA